MTSAFFSLNQSRTRQAINIFFWAYILMSVGFWVGFLDVPFHDDEWFLGICGIFSALALLFPWLVLRKRADEKTIGRLELLVLIMQLLVWIGSFGFYRIGLGYDSLAHFLISALGTVLFSLIFFFLAPAWSLARLILSGAICAWAGGFLNEGMEFGLDVWLGTQTFGEFGESTDTVKDLASNLIGVIGGGLYLMKKKPFLR